MKNKNKEAVAIYDLIAEDYAKKFDPIESVEDLIFPDLFLSHLKPGSKIIDLGCGTGFSTGYFIKKGMKAWGVDLSTGMITIARRNYPDIDFFVADIREFNPGKHVDAVWAGYSLFHFEQTYFEETLEKIKGYLRPHGIFGLVMQEGVGEIEPAEPFLPEKKIYIHLYTKEELKNILTLHGFEVIDQSIKKASQYEFQHDKILLICRLNNSKPRNIKAD